MGMLTDGRVVESHLLFLRAQLFSGPSSPSSFGSGCSLTTHGLNGVSLRHNPTTQKHEGHPLVVSDSMPQVSFRTTASSCRDAVAHVSGYTMHTRSPLLPSSRYRLVAKQPFGHIPGFAFLPVPWDLRRSVLPSRHSRKRNVT